MRRETLANKYRPKNWNEVVGQDTTTLILSKQIEEGSFKSSYLFVGPAGDGKTTTARIFSKQINKGNSGVIEIDAASNNSVEDVRKLVEKSSIQSITSEYKVYLIDECHAFSNQAWQAMLKLIEEPPKKTVFIFCTTDASKIPNTILSRVQRFDFKRINTKTIKERLLYVLKEESITSYNESAVELIAKLANGGMRDALTYLDKVISYSNNITVESVLSALGNVSYDTMFDLTTSLYNKDQGKTITLIENIYLEGFDLKQFISQYIKFILDLNTYQITKDANFISIPSDYLDKLTIISYKQFLISLLDCLVSINTDIRYESSPKYLILSKLLLLGEQK